MGENNSCSLGQRGMLKCYPAGSCFFPISLFELLTTVQGFGDAQDFSRALPALPNGAPPRPNTLTVDVCLTGVIYTAYIALHYFRKVPFEAWQLDSTSQCKRAMGKSAPCSILSGKTRSMYSRDLSMRLRLHCLPLTIIGAVELILAALPNS
jgi:hypothetical protein